jgi:hypothetical protein
MLCVFVSFPLCLLIKFLFILAEDDDTSIGSESEQEDENFHGTKSSCEEATSSKTIKHPRGKPQKNLSRVIKRMRRKMRI